MIKNALVNVMLFIGAAVLLIHACGGGHDDGTTAPAASSSAHQGESLLHRMVTP
jgi:hypothetical protein